MSTNTTGNTLQSDSRIFIAGHRGLVGSAILRKLKEKGYLNIVTRTRRQLDLQNQKKVDLFFEHEKKLSRHHQGLSAESPPEDIAGPRIGEH